MEAGKGTFIPAKIDMNLGSMVQTTPFQTEGPFYPVVDFFDYGNDLTQPYVATDEATENEIGGSTIGNSNSKDKGSSSSKIGFVSTIVAAALGFVSYALF